MSKYSTGELAKMCDVSVRTVQYYDSRNILVPSELSEGGRRLYSEEDLNKMQIICFLRDMGFSIDNIGKLFSDDNFEKVLDMLVEQQEELLSKEIEEQEQKLSRLVQMKRELKSFEHFSVQSIGDIAHILKTRKKRKKLLATMVCIGTVMDIIEICTVVYGIKTDIWWPLLVGIPIVIALGVFISFLYFNRIAYICPTCHEIFKPSLKESFFAAHTPNTRRLTCPKCGQKGFCVETYSEEEK